MRIPCLILVGALALSGCGFLLDLDPPDQKTLREEDAGVTIDAGSVDSGSFDANLSDVFVECEKNSDCPDDGIACTGVSCSSHRCVPHVLADVCDDAFECTQDECRPLASERDANGCVHVPSATECSDDVSCTRDLCNPTASSHDGKGCVHVADHTACDDSVPCTMDACVPNHPRAEDGCVHKPNDLLCVGSGTTCFAKVCTSFGCAEVYSGISCDSGLVCRADGTCGHLSTNTCSRNEQCDDGNPCNGDEACDTGFCVKTTFACAASTTDLCIEAVCDYSGTERKCAGRVKPQCYGSLDSVTIL